MDSSRVIQPRRAICFCTDEKYSRFVVPAIESIERSNPFGNYEYHIISDIEMPNVIRMLLETFLEVDRRVFWHHIDTGSFDGLKEVAHFTKAMYYRLSIPDVINTDKVLYLDCDIIVRKSLIPLFEIDLCEHYIGAVINPFFSRTELVPELDYFNSGVMLINCRKWKDENVLSKTLEILKTNDSIIKMPDQDALNLLFSGNWLRLDWSYNSQTSVYLFGRERGFFPCSAEDPAIVHFSGTNKQWHRSCGLIFSKEYLSLSTAITIPKRNRLFDLISVMYRYLKAIRFKSKSFFYVRL